MKARGSLFLYVAAVVLGTLVHEPAILAAGLAAVLALAGRQWLRIARRAVLAVLAFNAVVTFSYAVAATLQGDFSLRYVVLANLRVLFLTCLTFVASWLRDTHVASRHPCYSATVLTNT